MVIAICDHDAEGLLQGVPSAAVEAKQYLVAIADLAKRVKNAAGASLCILALRKYFA